MYATDLLKKKKIRLCVPSASGFNSFRETLNSLPVSQDWDLTYNYGFFPKLSPLQTSVSQTAI